VDPTAKQRGPFYSGCIRWRSNDDVIAYKGVVITLGKDADAYVCYDAELVRMSLGWITAEKRFGLSVPRFNAPPPTVAGSVAFSTAKRPGWANAGIFADPREGRRGPLPKAWAHHKGLYLHGRQVVLNYSVGSVDVLELPGFERVEKWPVFTRTFQMDQKATGLALAVLHVPGAELEPMESGVIVRLPKTGELFLAACEGGEGASWEVRAGSLILTLASVAANQPFRLDIAALGKTNEAPNDALALPPVPTDLRELTHGSAPLWPQPVVTQGVRAKDDAAYVVDHLTEPERNPWKADMLFGGFDFFDDGRAAICTAQGEVWVVSGIDDTLQKLSWRRFASGLFQPLGLRIVRGEVHVIGRDQITRLRDLNSDGEADHYENFNNDTILSTNPADYSLDLQTDSAGYFYFGKATPWFPDITTPHQGVIFKVSPDGAKSEIIATGLRVPNGLAIGPNGEIAVSENQGHWQPSSKVNLIRPGGFYGMMPAAQGEIEMKWGGKTITVNPSDPAVRQKLGFSGYGPKNPVPSGLYDRPLAWLPWTVDNSSGAPFWAITDKWGPLSGQLLFTSYGRCALFTTLRHKVGELEQAAMVPLNLPFDTGIMRGRVHPLDGQVYVAGLRGWLTTAQNAGGLYRVRHTGRPAHLPVDFTVLTTGVQLRFSDPLDPQTLGDLTHITAERWNYFYSGAYGSMEYSVTRPKEPRHDKLAIQSAHLSADNRTLTLNIDDMRKSHQLQLNLKLRTSDGTPIERVIYLTVPVLAEP
jgi:glucose/arabinose dehydrogenase